MSQALRARMFDKNIEALVVRENVDTTRAMTPRAVGLAGYPAAAVGCGLVGIFGVKVGAGTSQGRTDNLRHIGLQSVHGGRYSVLTPHFRRIAMSVRLPHPGFFGGLATVSALMAVAAALWGQDPTAANISRIRPGDRLYITASELLPDNPVKGTFLVEPSGKIALGPEYGRVQVSGLTVEEAEVLVREQLAKYIRDPHVSLTWYDAASHGDTALQNRVKRLEEQVAELRAAVEKFSKR